jgi:hypothetical protein
MKSIYKKTYTPVMDCLGLRGKCGGTGGFAQEGGRVPAVGLFTHGRARGGSLFACLTPTPPSPYIEMVPLMGC